MKNTIVALIALSSLIATAHEIEGVQMLKGSLKSEIRVNNVKTTCKAKVVKVKNAMEEDKFGNPAYKVQVEVSLDSGLFSDKRVKYEKKVEMTNLFANGVRDLEYQGEGVALKITDEGRLSSVKFPAAQYGSISCNF